MVKQTLFMSAFAVALVASPSEAQERRTCAWNDTECIRQGQRDPQARADQGACKWNDMECIRREQERARRDDRTDNRTDDRRGGRPESRSERRESCGSSGFHFGFLILRPVFRSRGTRRLPSIGSAGSPGLMRFGRRGDSRALLSRYRH